MNPENTIDPNDLNSGNTPDNSGIVPNEADLFLDVAHGVVVNDPGGMILPDSTPPTSNEADMFLENNHTNDASLYSLETVITPSRIEIEPQAPTHWDSNPNTPNEADFHEQVPSVPTVPDTDSLYLQEQNDHLDTITPNEADLIPDSTSEEDTHFDSHKEPEKAIEEEHSFFSDLFTPDTNSHTFEHEDSYQSHEENTYNTNDSNWQPDSPSNVESPSW